MSKDLLETLMQTTDSLATALTPRTEWLQSIDNMLEQIHAKEVPTQSHEQDHNYEATLSMDFSTWKESTHDHTYDVARTSPEVQCYIAGFVVRSMMKKLKCQDCLSSLKSSDEGISDPTHAAIDLLEKFGGLLRPSEPLFRLTECLELAVLDVTAKSGVRLDTIQTILERVSSINNVRMLGCADHYMSCTQKIVDFYITMRAFFLTNSYNANQNESRIKTKRLRKNAKL